MKHYQLKIVSKTKESLNNFLNLFNDTHTNFCIIKKFFKHKIKQKIFTLLKSPHIYKSAQEQFQSKFFSSQVIIYFNDNYQSFILLKKIKNNLFPDLKIKIKFPINADLINKEHIRMFHSYLLNIKCSITSKKLKQKNHKHLFAIFETTNSLKIKNLIVLIDVFGNQIIKISLDSSAWLEQRTENPCVGSSNLSLNRLS